MLYIKSFASEKKSMKLDNRRNVHRPGDIKKIAISSLAEAFINLQKGM